MLAMIKRLNETKNKYLAVINFQHFHYLSYLCHEKKTFQTKTDFIYTYL